jgi:hypothetical protein
MIAMPDAAWAAQQSMQYSDGTWGPAPPDWTPQRLYEYSVQYPDQVRGPAVPQVPAASPGGQPPPPQDSKAMKEEAERRKKEAERAAKDAEKRAREAKKMGRKAADAAVELGAYTRMPVWMQRVMSLFRR